MGSLECLYVLLQPNGCFEHMCILKHGGHTEHPAETAEQTPIGISGGNLWQAILFFTCVEPAIELNI
jgi:hypothetical protein